MKQDNTVSDKINLSVDTDNLQRFCQKLIKRSRDVAKTHDALVTLESFIILFGKAAHGTKEYQAVEELIKSFSEQTRQLLLRHRTEQLLPVIKNCDVAAVTAIHTPLSRDGFYSILQTVVAQLADAELEAITQWASKWSADAKQKAEQASGFPDAMEFNKAGIRLEEYQAMLDVRRYLENRD